MTRAETLTRLAEIHNLRRLRAQKNAMEAADRVASGQDAVNHAQLSLRFRKIDMGRYAAKEFAELGRHTDFDAFLSALALRGIACARALASAETQLSQSRVTLRQAENQQQAAAQDRLRTEGRADRIDALASDARSVIARRAADRVEAEAADVFNGRMLP